MGSSSRKLKRHVRDNQEIRGGYMNQKKKILLAAIIAVFLVIPLLIALTYYTVVKPNEPTIKVTIDPITGERIIDGGTTPERGQDGTNEPVTGPVIYGFDNIAGLYGNSNVMIALRDQFFKHEFGDKKIVKISPKDIVKKSLNNPETGEGSISVKFYIYLNDDTVNKYTMETKLNQETSIVDITLTKPNGEKVTTQIDASSI